MSGRTLLTRRRLAAALLGTGSLALAACSRGPQPVATDPDLTRDPLASVDQAQWDTRSAHELLSLPLEGDLAEYSAWTDSGLDDSSVAGARQQLVDFLTGAYLSPDELTGLSDADAQYAISTSTPNFWKDDLAEGFTSGSRHFYAYVLADAFADVGAPRICANWYRGQTGALPQLLFGGTIARTVIDTGSRDVGVVALRFAMRMDVDGRGESTRGMFQVTVHGMDLCATGEAKGLIVPAIGPEEAYVAVQEATMEQVIGSPRVPRKAMDSTSSEAMLGDEETVVLCP